MAAEKLNDKKLPAKNTKEVASVSKTPDTELKAMTVVGEAVQDPNDPYNKDYKVANASTATKTDTPIFDTPASIQVVSRALMDDQQVISLDSALKNVSGVFKSFSFGGQIENFNIRGFEVNRRVFRDGFLNPSFNEYETADLERVEVLKGPAGFLYGRIEPGGMINLVTKRPRAQPYYSLQQQFGSYDLFRTSLDATGTVPKTNEALLYRLNFSYLSNNSFRDFVGNERKYVAPSFTLKLGDNTQLDFDFYYKDEDIVTDLGIPPIGKRPANLPSSRPILYCRI
jgi:iron complex outermembrane receptor protein